MDVNPERNLGAYLVAQGVITPVQFRRAWQARHQIRQSDLGRVLVDLGFVSEVMVLQARAALHGLAFIDLDHVDIDPRAVNVISAAVAIQHRVITIQKDHRLLTVATSNWEHCLREDNVRLGPGIRVQWVVAAPEAIDAAIARHYGETAGGA